MTRLCRRTCGSSSICRSAIPRTLPTRSARSRWHEALGEPDLSHAKRHRDIIRRFGRFPHRNPILGRAMTAEEQRYLDEGGYAG